MSLRILLLLACGTAAVKAQPVLEVREASLPFDGGVVLHLSVVPFDSTEHRLEPCELEGGPCLIDGVPMFGTDYTVPETVLASAALEVGGRRVPLDVSGMTNPWWERPDEGQFTVEPFGPYHPERWTVRAALSDGAGSYVAVWEVARGGAVRTVLMDAYSYEPCRE